MINIVNKRYWNGENNELTVYVGRPSPLGNPYIMRDENQRGLVIAMYETWLRKQLLQDTPQKKEMQRLVDLYVKWHTLTLVCWCAPKRCHAEVIAKIVEEIGEFIIDQYNDEYAKFIGEQS